MKVMGTLKYWNVIWNFCSNKNFMLILARGRSKSLGSVSTSSKTIKKKTKVVPRRQFSLSNTPVNTRRSQRMSAKQGISFCKTRSKN